MSNTMPGTSAQPTPEVKKNLAIVALIITIIASILIIVAFVVSAKAGLAAIENLDVDAALSADSTRVGMLVVASIMNLVAFILALVALIKSHPKTMPLIIFIVVIVLPGIASGIGMAVQNSILPAV